MARRQAVDVGCKFMDTSTIIDAIQKSRKPTSKVISLTDYSGLYCFFLNGKSSLDIFGKDKQAIYVGISVNLNGRELKQHLKSGETGWSSFRRSIGAILKKQLKLEATHRDLNPKKLRADKYKFKGDGEARLTNWILENTELGYWTMNTKLGKNHLELLETEVIKILKPTLDLHKATKHLNPLATQLDKLREVCRNEVKSAANKSIAASGAGR